MAARRDEPDGDSPPEQLRDALLAMAREAEAFREELRAANANFDRARNAPGHRSYVLEDAQKAEREEAWARQRLAGATLAAAAAEKKLADARGMPVRHQPPAPAPRPAWAEAALERARNREINTRPDALHAARLARSEREAPERQARLDADVAAMRAPAEEAQRLYLEAVAKRKRAEALAGQRAAGEAEARGREASDRLDRAHAAKLLGAPAADAQRRRAGEQATRDREDRDAAIRETFARRRQEQAERAAEQAKRAAARDAAEDRRSNEIALFHLAGAMPGPLRHVVHAAAAAAPMFGRAGQKFAEAGAAGLGTSAGASAAASGALAGLAGVAAAGAGVVAAFRTATATVHEFAAAASPGAASTFNSSLGLLSAKIGHTFVPALDAASQAAQKAGGLWDRAAAAKMYGQTTWGEGIGRGAALPFQIWSMNFAAAGAGLEGKHIAPAILPTLAEIITGKTSDMSRNIDPRFQPKYTTWEEYGQRANIAGLQASGNQTEQQVLREQLMELRGLLTDIRDNTGDLKNILPHIV